MPTKRERLTALMVLALPLSFWEAPESGLRGDMTPSAAAEARSAGGSSSQQRGGPCRSAAA